MKGITERRNDNGFYVLQVHYSADRDKDPETQEGKKWIKEAKQGVPDFHWQQEYEIKWVTDASFFRNVRKCIRKSIVNEEPLPLQEFMCDNCGHVFRRVSKKDEDMYCPVCREEVEKEEDVLPSYYTGIDLGQIGDYTAVYTVQYHPEKEKLRVVYHDHFKGLPWEQTAFRIMKPVKKYGGICYIDSTGLGDPIVEGLIRKFGEAVEGVKFTNKSKSDMINKLAILFEEELIELPEDEGLILELENFKAQKLNGGKWRYSAPSGQHDDRVFALALAVRRAHKMVREMEL